MNKAGITDAVHAVVGGIKTTAEQAVAKVRGGYYRFFKERRRGFLSLGLGIFFRQGKELPDKREIREPEKP